jgi:toxin ParE1/3/4
VRIEWSQRARADIRDLKAYIAKDSPHYARRFTERIIASVEKLAQFPNIGRPVPEAQGRDDVRELIYQGYRIIYHPHPRQPGSGDSRREPLGCGIGRKHAVSTATPGLGALATKINLSPFRTGINRKINLFPFFLRWACNPTI